MPKPRVVARSRVGRTERPATHNTSGASLDVTVVHMQPATNLRGPVAYVEVALVRTTPGAAIPTIAVRRSELLPLIAHLETAARELGLLPRAGAAEPPQPAPAPDSWPVIDTTRVTPV